MKNLKTKKASHVGIILSFVIFISFLLIIFSYIYPASTTSREKQFFLDYMKKIVVENTSSELTTMSFKVNSILETSSCFSIPKPSQHSDKKIKTYFEKDASLTPVDSNSDSSRINIYDGGIVGKFYRVYMSEEFIESTESDSCTSAEGDYEISSTKTNSYTSLKRLNSLESVSYEELKTQWNIPAGTDFILNYSLNGDGSKEIGYQGNLPDTNIYSENIPITYFNSEAEINLGFINIQVW